MSERMGPVQSTSSVLFFGMDINGDCAWVDMIAGAKSCRPDYGLCRGGTSRMRPVRSRSEQVVEVEGDAASRRASIVRDSPLLLHMLLYLPMHSSDCL
jgi:hypothetical protein